MRNSVGREIRLVVRIERLQNPMRKKIAKGGTVSCHRHHERKDNVGDREAEHSPRSNDRLNRLSAANGYPGALDKQELPGERIEVPKARWRARKIPPKMPCSKIHSHRTSQCQCRFAHHQPQGWSKRSQQQNIERKYVQIDGLVSQNQGFDKLPGRLAHENGDVELTQIIRIMKSSRNVSDGDDIDGEHNDVGGVQLKSTLYQSRCSRNVTLLNHYSSEHACGRVTGYENKQVSRVAESVIAGRDRAQHLVRDVIQKDRPISQTAKQVQSEVSPSGRKCCADSHGRALLLRRFRRGGLRRCCSYANRVACYQCFRRIIDDPIG